MTATVIRNLCPIEGRNGVHDTTISSTCACGQTFRVPRYGFGAHVFDNGKQGDDKNWLDEGFMTDQPETIVEALRRMANKIERGA